MALAAVLLSCARNLVDASFTDVVSSNSDTLYCIIQFDLKKEPVVVVVPPIAADRYYTFQFLDAYTNVFAYIGTRATGSNGGTYLIAGPNCTKSASAVSGRSFDHSNCFDRRIQRVREG
jgi:hypothetical protein